MDPTGFSVLLTLLILGIRETLELPMKIEDNPNVKFIEDYMASFSESDFAQDGVLLRYQSPDAIKFKNPPHFRNGTTVFNQRGKVTEAKKVVVLSGYDDYIRRSDSFLTEQRVFVTLTKKEGTEDHYYVNYAYVRTLFPGEDPVGAVRINGTLSRIELDTWDRRGADNNLETRMGWSVCSKSFFISCLGDPTRLVSYATGDEPDYPDELSETGKQPNSGKLDDPNDPTSVVYNHGYFTDLADEFTHSWFVGASVIFATNTKLQLDTRVKTAESADLIEVQSNRVKRQDAAPETATTSTNEITTTIPAESGDGKAAAGTEAATAVGESGGVTVAAESTTATGTEPGGTAIATEATAVAGTEPGGTAIATEATAIAGTESGGTAIATEATAVAGTEPGGAAIATEATAVAGTEPGGAAIATEAAVAGTEPGGAVIATEATAVGGTESGGGAAVTTEATPDVGGGEYGGTGIAAGATTVSETESTATTTQASQIEPKKPIENKGGNGGDGGDKQNGGKNPNGGGGGKGNKGGSQHGSEGNRDREEMQKCMAALEKQKTGGGGQEMKKTTQGLQRAANGGNNGRQNQLNAGNGGQGRQGNKNSPRNGINIMGQFLSSFAGFKVGKNSNRSPGIAKPNGLLNKFAGLAGSIISGIGNLIIAPVKMALDFAKVGVKALGLGGLFGGMKGSSDNNAANNCINQLARLKQVQEQGKQLRKSGRSFGSKAVNMENMNEKSDLANVDMYTPLGWRGLYSHQSEPFIGLGSCIVNDNFTISDLNSIKNAPDAATFYLKTLRTNCNEGQKKQLLDLIKTKELIYSPKDQTFSISPTHFARTKKKLLPNAAARFAQAFEMQEYTRAYVAEFRNPTKYLRNPDNLLIQRAVLTLRNMALNSFSVANTQFPGHTIKLMRNLLITLKTAFVRLLQSWQVVSVCQTCLQQQWSLGDDIISVISVIDFIMYKFEPAIPAEGIKPEQVFLSYESFYLERRQQFAERLAAYVLPPNGKIGIPDFGPGVNITFTEGS